jgi:hypothetical protein
LVALMNTLGVAPPPPPATTPRLPATAPLRANPAAAPLSEADATSPDASAPAEPLSAAELQALEAAAQKVKTQDAASFWDAATDGGTVADRIGDVRAGTLSFDQAAQLGLINAKK